MMPRPTLLPLSLLLMVAWLAESTSSLRQQGNHQQPLHRSLIIGGQPVPLQQHDTYRAFAWSGMTSGGWGCGGALIHSDFVLTAAHCQWAFYESMQVMVGAFQIDNADNEGNVLDIRRVIPHPDFLDNGSAQNDILLLHLSEVVTDITPFDYNMDPDFPHVMQEPLTIVGFGTTSEGGSVSQVLRTVDVYEFSYDNCKATYPDALKNISLCAGTVEGGKDGCDSDSGSPYIVNNTVVAVTDDGPGCGHPNVPSVNARVSGFADWIHGTICEHSQDPPSTCTKKELAKLKKATTSKAENDSVVPPPASYPEGKHPVIDPKTKHTKRNVIVIALVAIALIANALNTMHQQRQKKASYQEIPSQ